jgi:predicted DNA-binding transcriptional regulator YafY
MRRLEDELLGLLSDRGPWTGQSLAQRLGVGLRTVRRALARLKDAGVAIDADVGRGGGLRLGLHAGLPRLRLHHLEAVQLLLALAVTESLSMPLMGRELGALRHKLAAAFPSDERVAIGRLRRRVLVGASASPTVLASWRPPRPSVALRLQEAFVSQVGVRIRYVDAQQQATQRWVEPHYLMLSHPAWYLLAYDIEKQAGRCFRLDRIDTAELNTHRFVLRSAVSLQSDPVTGFESL